MEVLDEARELFRRCHGRHWLMCRDCDAYGRYLKLKISKLQERIWTEELQGEIMQRITAETDPDRMVREIGDLALTFSGGHQDPVAFSTLLDFISTKLDDCDSLTRLEISEQILQIVFSFDVARQGRHRVCLAGRQIAESILRGLMSAPLILSASHLRQAAEDPRVSQGKMTIRARRAIAECTGEWSDEIREILREGDELVAQGKAPYMLPPSMECLELILDLLENGHWNQRSKERFSGFGRLLTEDLTFAESELGSRVLKICNAVYLDTIRPKDVD